MEAYQKRKMAEKEQQTSTIREKSTISI